MSKTVGGFFSGLLVLLLLALPGQSLAGDFFGAFSGDMDIRAYYDDISGNEALSFKQHGFNYLTDFYLYYDSHLGQTDDLLLSGQLVVRATDDQQFKTSDDRVRVENLYLTAEKLDRWYLTGGYFSGNFSPLTMNTTQLGFQGSYQLTGDILLTAFGGRDRRARTDQYRRLSSGFQLRWDETTAAHWELNFVRTRDHASSADIVELPRSNRVLSLATERQLLDGQLQLHGEAALAEIEDGDTSHENQLAYRAGIEINPLDRLRLDYRFERTDRQFESLTASVLEDRIIHRSTVNYQPQILGLENWEIQLLGQRDIDEYTRGDTQDRRILRGGVNYWAGGVDWLQSLRLETERRWREDQIIPEDNRILELSGGFNLGGASLLLATQYEDIRKQQEKSRSHRAVYDWQGDIWAQPLDWNLGFEYRKDRVERTAVFVHDRRNIIDNYLVIGRGREQLFIGHRYDYDRRGGDQADVVQEEFNIGIEFHLNPALETSLAFSYEWFDSRDKGDSSRNYTENSYELRFRSQF